MRLLAGMGASQKKHHKGIFGQSGEGTIPMHEMRIFWGKNALSMKEPFLGSIFFFNS